MSADVDPDAMAKNMRTSVLVPTFLDLPLLRGSQLINTYATDCPRGSRTLYIGNAANQDIAVEVDCEIFEVLHVKRRSLHAQCGNVGDI